MLHYDDACRRGPCLSMFVVFHLAMHHNTFGLQARLYDRNITPQPLSALTTLPSTSFEQSYIYRTGLACTSFQITRPFLSLPLVLQDLDRCLQQCTAHRLFTSQHSSISTQPFPKAKGPTFGRCYRSICSTVCE